MEAADEQLQKVGAEAFFRFQKCVVEMKSSGLVDVSSEDVLTTSIASYAILPTLLDNWAHLSAFSPPHSICESDLSKFSSCSERMPLISFHDGCTSRPLNLTRIRGIGQRNHPQQRESASGARTKSCLILLDHHYQRRLT